MRRLSISVMFIVWAAIGFIGCGSREAAPPAGETVRSFKGYELYSWRSDGEWNFSLLVGTNRIKTRAEVLDPAARILGLDELKRRLDRLPRGEQVFWSARHEETPEIALPPDSLIAEIDAYCDRRGIELATVR